ncbi:MAG: tetratricopeptide repeat protein, partial [bacterium]|nr:tetratricopeptide repeat protein [bacterium]
MLRNIITTLMVVAFLSAALIVVFTGCKKDEDVSNIEEGIAKEDQVINELQSKVDKRQAELDKMENERRAKTGDLAELETQKRDEAIRKYEEFLGKYPISPYTPDILVSLGELYFERSEDEHVVALDDWQRRMEEDETGTFYQPEPQPHYEKTISAYQQITLRYRDNPYADVAFYGLGYCQWAQNEWEDSAKTFYELAKNYPDSRFTAEAYFRIGEYYFETWEFEKAVKYYAMVPPDNPDFYDKALYKMGWAYYNMGDIGVSSDEYRKSIEAFTTLIEVSKGESVLTDEAMEFTAISLTEWSTDPDEDISASKALENYGGVFETGGGKTYSANILHELGDVYLFRQDKLSAASEVYETVLSRYPDYNRAPEVMDSLVECYLREENYEDAHKTRIRIVDSYGPMSTWYANNDDPDIRNEGIKRWEENLYNVATYYNTQGEKKQDEEAFNNAISRYNQYLEAFPVNTKAYHVNFFLAESYYAVEDFNRAGEQYHKTALGYTDEDRYEIPKWDEKFTREDALFSAVASYNSVFVEREEEIINERKENHTPVDKVESLPAPADGITYVEAKGPVEPTKEPLTVEDANLIRACNVFVDKYPQSKDVAMVLSRRGEVYYFVKDYEKARESYNIVVKDYRLPPEGAKAEEHDELYVDACETVARTYWDEAEFYHKKAKEYREANPIFAIENLDKAAAKYEKASGAYAKTLSEIEARDLKTYKRPGETISVYDKVNKLSSYGLVLKGDLLAMRADIDPSLSMPFIVDTTDTEPEIDIEPVVYDTAEKLDTLDNPNEDLLVEARDPISPARKDVLIEAAEVYEENADANQGEEVGRLSLGKAAETYDQAQDYGNAGRVYQKYATTYPDAEDSTDAWKKATEMYELDEDYGKAAQVFLMINENPKLKDVPMGEDAEALSFGEIALFQAAVCYQIMGDYETAAETYDRFNDEYQAHAIPRIKATYRQAKMYEKMNMKAAAIDPFTETVTLYKASKNMDIDVSETDPYVAEAYFKLADEGFDEYDQIQLIMPQSVLEKNMLKRVELSQQLIARYNDCAALNQTFWTIACHTRTGDVYLSFRDALFNAGVPAEIEPSVWEHLPADDPTRAQYEAVYYEYKGALDEQGYALEESGIGSYTEAINLAESTGIFNDYYDTAYDKMMVLRPTDVVKYDDIAINGLRSDNTWSVGIEIEDVSWNKTTYDDSAWMTTVVSTWREKDIEERTGTPAGDPSPIWDSLGTETVFLRKMISVTFATEFSASIQSRGSYELYIDGVMVGSGFEKDGWMSPDEYDVSSYLEPGDHIIAIKSKRSKRDSYGVMFSIRPSSGFPEESTLYDEMSYDTGLTPMVYQCPTCSYVYDSETEGIDLYETVDEWVCPDCGTDKWSFTTIDTGFDDTSYDTGLTPMVYQCPTCGYVYDSATEGIDIYETVDEWVCPDCGTDKWSFTTIDTGFDD